MRSGPAPTLPPWTRGHQSGPTDGAATDETVSPGVLVAIVNAAGDIDGSTVVPFEREVERTLEAGATRMLVDLSRADDLTSTCMNALLSARLRLFGRGRIAVVLSPRMRHHFRTLGLDGRFLLADSRLHAVRLLGLGDPGAPRTHAPRPHAHAA
jgi:anti-anti-sigma regulatory factor